MRLEVSGSAAGVDDFLGSLRNEAPPQARIDSVEIEELPPLSAQASTGATFEIRSAAGDALPRPTIPADLATCDACRKEIAEPNERRYRYPFTNCTNCGPRWSIIRQLPYDRPRTSMARFPLCPACQAEYDDPADRRFHAQPVACPQCGPQLRLLDARGQLKAQRDEALKAAAEALAAGQVVALQGLGGFQLLVDATTADAVDRLRRRKHRPDRPFALMFPTLDAVRRCCHVSEDEARELLSPAAPILLLRRRVASADTNPKHQRGTDLAASLTFRIAVDCADVNRQGHDIAENVAPGNPYLGVMLPYTPLHHLLMEAVARPLVCTSGNLSEEPMAIEIDDALQRLGGLGPSASEPIADLSAGPRSSHRAAGGRFGGPRRPRRPAGLAAGPRLCPAADQVEFRRAPDPGRRRALEEHRGPGRWQAGPPSPPAPKGEGRNLPASVVLSQHIGDLESVLSLGVFRRTIDDLLEFFAANPQAVACDLHPDYASTRYAEELARRFQRSHRPRATSSRPRRRVHGGAWSRWSRAGARLGRHGLRPRRHDLGRRGPLVPRRGLPSRGPSANLPLARRRLGGEAAAAGGTGAVVRNLRAPGLWGKTG